MKSRIVNWVVGLRSRGRYREEGTPPHPRWQQAGVTPVHPLWFSGAEPTDDETYLLVEDIEFDIDEEKATIIPIPDDDGGVLRYLSLQTEITDIEFYDKYLDALDDVLRHDLRNELTVILGQTDALVQGLLDDPAEESEAIRTIANAAQNLPPPRPRRGNSPSSSNNA